MKPLQLALPIMLHQDETINQFKAARDRLGELGAKYGVPIEVGAFLIFMPPVSYDSANMQKQLENQARERLPIALVETAITAQNSLAYVPNDPTYDPEAPSNLEVIIEQAAKLRDLDPNPRDELVVGPHIGIKVVDIQPGNYSNKCFYSPQDFLRLRNQLFINVVERFVYLKRIASSNGLVLAPENAFPAIVADSTRWRTGQVVKETDKFSLHYEPFNDLVSLKNLSWGNGIVFDLAHLACTLDAQAAFTRNGADPTTLFRVYDVSSWREFNTKIANSEIGRAGAYYHEASAIHIADVEGIGVRVPAGTDLARQWGGGGALPNLISTKQYVDALQIAQRVGLVVSIEQEYQLKPIQHYKEADAFVEPILAAWHD